MYARTRWFFCHVRHVVYIARSVALIQTCARMVLEEIVNQTNTYEPSFMGIKIVLKIGKVDGLINCIH